MDSGLHKVGNHKSEPLPGESRNQIFRNCYVVDFSAPHKKSLEVVQYLNYANYRENWFFIFKKRHKQSFKVPDKIVLSLSPTAAIHTEWVLALSCCKEPHLMLWCHVMTGLISPVNDASASIIPSQINHVMGQDEPWY